MSLSLVAGIEVVHIALEEYATGVVNSLNLLGCKATTRETYFVHAGKRHRVGAQRDVRWNVLADECTALNHCVVADVAPLVNGCMSADDYPIANFYLAGERYSVCDYAVAADNVIVCHVNVCHKQVTAANDGFATRCCTTTDGYILANVVVIANLGSGLLASELKILWKTRDRCCGVNLATLTDTQVYFPSLKYATDNAAMIAAYAYHKFQEDGADGLDTGVYPRVTGFKISLVQ